jgi:MoaA/NifB/PqqE/SkfB family radical SAM enzyme
MERNAAAVLAALGPLYAPRFHEAIALGPPTPDPSEPLVTVSLTAGGDTIQLVLSAPDPAREAFFRSPSFDVRYAREAGEASAPPPLRRALELVRRALGARDRGQYSLATPPAARRRLPMHPDAMGAMGAMGVQRPAPPAPGERLHRFRIEQFEARVGRALAEPSSLRQVVVVVSQPCELQCQFCPSVDRDKAHDDWMEKGDAEQLADLRQQLARAAALGARRVEVGGNDVLRFAPVLALVDHAVAHGYERIALQSTGLPLEDRALVEALARWPQVTVHVPIYGANAAAHDAITRTPGSFARLGLGLDHVRAVGGPRVELHSVALASTLSELPALADFVQARFALPLRVGPLRANRVGERSHLDDSARLADVRALGERHPELLDAEFPACVLPPSRRPEPAGGAGSPARARSVNLYDLGMVGDEHADVVRSRSYQRPAACTACLLRDECCGVLVPYLERFGDGELVPITEG